MRRDNDGNRVVSARTAAGVSLASVLAGATALIGVARWLDIPSIADYRSDQQEIIERLDTMQDAVNALDRRMRLFGLTDEEIERRLRDRQGG